MHAVQRLHFKKGDRVRLRDTEDNMHGEGVVVGLISGNDYISVNFSLKGLSSD